MWACLLTPLLIPLWFLRTGWGWGICCLPVCLVWWQLISVSSGVFRVRNGFPFGFLPFPLFPASRNTALLLGRGVPGLGGLVGPCCPRLPRKGKSAPRWLWGREMVMVLARGSCIPNACSITREAPADIWGRSQTPGLPALLCSPVPVAVGCLQLSASPSADASTPCLPCLCNTSLNPGPFSRNLLQNPKQTCLRFYGSPLRC